MSTQTLNYANAGAYHFRTSGPFDAAIRTGPHWPRSTVSANQMVRRYLQVQSDPIVAGLDELDDWGDSSIETMLASEEVLARDWNTPEEDEAWANL